MRARSLPSGQVEVSDNHALTVAEDSGVLSVELKLSEYRASVSVRDATNRPNRGRISRDTHWRRD